ncbi:sodium-dependent glucose transporter 1A-like [Mercenaria mercenaria]|uniref:sodium-dependent glucose transporter 1A-like n=1 Tax=Mercenaria mercenaria TaxID=6596 RepID=UPI00234E8507|nr:sodium-dependent glucose transporter 1A-like [Mercenaria mercenaria]
MVSESACKVFMLFLVWCSMGLYQEIPGPTMIDIKLIFNATYEEVSRSVSGRGAGGFCGALIGGFLVDRFSHSSDLIIAVSETIAALAIMFVPYSHSANTIWFHYFFTGICGVTINIAGVRSVINLFPEKTAVCLQLLHVGYGAGALLVPVFVNPFLAVVKILKIKSGNHDTESEVIQVVRETHVHSAFVGIGIGTLLLSTVFYRYHCNKCTSKGYKQVVTEDKEIEEVNALPKEEVHKSEKSSYRICILIVIFIYYFIMVGGEEVFGQFVRTFSLEVFNFTKTKASFLNMTFWLGLTIGRLFGSLMANFIHIRRLFLIQVVSHAFSTTLLYLYASRSSAMLWFCTVTEGFLISPLYPGGIAYGNTLIELSGFCLMVIQLAGSLGDLSFIWIAGKMYDTYGPKSLLYGLQVIGIILVICVILFRVMERFKKEKKVDILVKT